MARVTIHKCDRCGAESRDKNNLTEVSMPSGGFERELCPSCIERLDRFLRVDAVTGNHYFDAEILRAAADVLRANQDDPILESALRTKAAMMEDEE